MKKTKILPILIYLGILLMILSWIMNAFGVGNSNLPYSKIVEMFRNEQVKSFVVEDHTIELKLTAPYNGKTTVTAPLADPEGFRQELGALFEEQVAAGVLESYDFRPETGFSPYDLVLPLLIVGVVHTGLTYCMYFSSLKELPGQKAAILSYIDPLVAVLISVTVLGEAMTASQLIGGALILGFTLWNEIGTKE